MSLGNAKLGGSLHTVAAFLGLKIPITPVISGVPTKLATVPTASAVSDRVLLDGFCWRFSSEDATDLLRLLRKTVLIVQIS